MGKKRQRLIENKSQERLNLYSHPPLFNCATDLKVLINHSLEKIPKDENLSGATENIRASLRFLPYTQGRTKSMVKPVLAHLCQPSPSNPGEAPTARGSTMACQLETSQREGGDVKRVTVAVGDAILRLYYLILVAHGYPFVQLDTMLYAC